MDDQVVWRFESNISFMITNANIKENRTRIIGCGEYYSAELSRIKSSENNARLNGYRSHNRARRQTCMRDGRKRHLPNMQTGFAYTTSGLRLNIHSSRHDQNRMMTKKVLWQNQLTAIFQGEFFDEVEIMLTERLFAKQPLGSSGDSLQAHRRHCDFLHNVQGANESRKDLWISVLYEARCTSHYCSNVRSTKSAQIRSKRPPEQSILQVSSR